MDSIPAKTFQDLVVWQRSHEFVLMISIYSDFCLLTSGFCVF